jgi:hypothetical protein
MKTKTKTNLSKNFFTITSCPKCKTKNMRILDLFDYSVVEYHKSQTDDSWTQMDNRTGELTRTVIQCLDCDFEDSWIRPKWK